MDGPPDSEVPRFLARLTDQARTLVGADDVAITRFSPPDRWDVVHATSRAVERLEEAAFTVGEGPTWEAWHERRPVFVSDLSGPRTRARWPVWSTGIAATGRQAMAVFPVQVGVVLLGTFSVYREVAGVFTDQQTERASALADAVLVGLLDELAGVPPDGELPAPREFFSAGVYQACGMVMVQLGLDATQALVALRAHAFAVGRPLREVADDVVNRRFTFSTEIDPA